MCTLKYRSARDGKRISIFPSGSIAGTIREFPISWRKVIPQVAFSSSLRISNPNAGISLYVCSQDSEWGGCSAKIRRIPWLACTVRLEFSELIVPSLTVLKSMDNVENHRWKKIYTPYKTTSMCPAHDIRFFPNFVCFKINTSVVLTCCACWIPTRRHYSRFPQKVWRVEHHAEGECSACRWCPTCMFHCHVYPRIWYDPSSQSHTFLLFHQCAACHLPQ